MRGNVLVIDNVRLYSYINAHLVAAIQTKQEENACELAAALPIHMETWQQHTDADARFVYADTLCPDTALGTCKPDSHLG